MHRQDFVPLFSIGSVGINHNVVKYYISSKEKIANYLSPANMKIILQSIESINLNNSLEYY